MKRRLQRIMTCAIEREILDYFNSIATDIVDNFYEDFKDFDCDDLKSMDGTVQSIFKDLTDDDIYIALGTAYNYSPSSIKNKIDRQRRVDKAWAKYHADIHAMRKNFTAQEEADIVEYAYVLQINYRPDQIRQDIVEAITNLERNGMAVVAWLSEGDIYAIKKAMSERSDAIYEGEPDSKVIKSLVRFHRAIFAVQEKKKEKKEKIEAAKKVETLAVEEIPTEECCDKDTKTLAEYVDLFNSMDISHATINTEYNGIKWWITFNIDRS